jgi:hypothetical protein
MDRRKWEKRKTGTAKKTTGALLLLTALLTGSILLSGCSAWLMSEGLDGDEGWSDYEEEDDEGYSGGSATIGGDSSYQSSVLEDNSLKGTVISQENGQMQISRRSRDEEIPMGDGDWTIFVYLCGSDLESDGGAASSDIEEAFAARGSGQVKVVYQTGGSYFWYQNINENRVQRYLLEDGDLTLVDEKPEANMGTASTLADFLSWGVSNYPSERMGLILWDHGSGSINGVCFDEQYDYDSLTLGELDHALNQVYDQMTDRFEFIGFDACLMSTLETANVLTPYARYMYASQEMEPGSGWDYTSLLNNLAANPDQDGAQLGEKVCREYYDHCADYGFGSQRSATFSIIDLSKIDDVLISMNEAFRVVYEQGDLGDVTRAVLEADSFGGNSVSEGYSNMLDLGNMLDQLSGYGQEVRDASQTLQSCVLYTMNGRLHKNASGLSVYYPVSIQGSEELKIFSRICPSNYYYALIDKIAYGAENGSAADYDNSTLLSDMADINEWLGEESGFTGDVSTNAGEFADIEIGQMGVSDIYFDEDGIYTVSFDNMDELAYACCSVGMDDDADGFFYLGTTEEVIYDIDRNCVTDNFDGSWPCINDNLLALELVNTTDSCSIYTCNVLLNDEVETNLRIEYDWEYDEWSVIGIWDGIDEETGMASREVYELQDGDVITPAYYWFSVDDDWYYGDDIVVDGDLEITYEYLPEGVYYYCFELHDIYGNVYYTPFTLQYVDEDGEVWVDGEFY